MARETTKWPSTRWPITKIMSSDGCNGNRVPLEMGPWYDFREFGCHLGNVGLNRLFECVAQNLRRSRKGRRRPNAWRKRTGRRREVGSSAIILAAGGCDAKARADSTWQSRRRTGISYIVNRGTLLFLAVAVPIIFSGSFAMRHR